MTLCKICGEPEGGTFRHGISADEAAQQGSRKCRGKDCKETAVPTCCLGLGHYVYRCPKGDVDLGP